MPDNNLTRDCLHKIGGAQLFMSPTWTPDQKGVKVQIVDVFALELATGYSKDPEGRLLLSSEPSVSSGRTWSLAKACQLVRNDRRPERWVVLHRHKKAWGLFWVGGGLDQCRAALTAAMGVEQAGGALVPATPDALLRLILTLEEPEVEPVLITKVKKGTLALMQSHASRSMLPTIGQLSECFELPGTHIVSKCIILDIMYL
jgi:hypothetical protein